VPANPKLAEQHRDYTAKQLANFKSGERKNVIMAGFAAGLSPEDMKSLGAYFEKQTLKPAIATDKTLALQGEKIYRGGIAPKGVPACSGCHSPNGAGMPAQYPRIQGQFKEYTLAQLQAFRSGQRANDPAQMMRMIAARLTDQEMDALSEYIAGLR
jgi:cytochrome c553